MIARSLISPCVVRGSAGAAPGDSLPTLYYTPGVPDSYAPIFDFDRGDLAGNTDSTHWGSSLVPLGACQPTYPGAQIPCAMLPRRRSGGLVSRLERMSHEAAAACPVSSA
jgi:hypothetical protein